MSLIEQGTLLLDARELHPLLSLPTVFAHLLLGFCRHATTLLLVLSKLPLLISVNLRPEEGLLLNRSKALLTILQNFPRSSLAVQGGKIPLLVKCLQALFQGLFVKIRGSHKILLPFSTSFRGQVSLVAGAVLTR
jgi:hypothetical protein